MGSGFGLKESTCKGWQYRNLTVYSKYTLLFIKQIRSIFYIVNDAPFLSVRKVKTLTFHKYYEALIFHDK